MQTNKPISFREDVARFLEQPTRDGLRRVLKEQLGEFRDLEFKAEWPDTPKLAKHILAMANSGGGCFVFGISEVPGNTHEPTGLAAIRDKADFTNALRGILPSVLLDQLLVMDFHYEASEYPALVGKFFQILIVPNDPSNLPFLAASETTGIRRTEIYIRRMASTEAATHEDIQRILNQRIATGHSTQHGLDLTQHLEDLRKLYSQLELFYAQHPMGIMVGDYFHKRGFVTVGSQIVRKESYDDFINRMIFLKQRAIKEALQPGHVASECC